MRQFSSRDLKILLSFFKVTTKLFTETTNDLLTSFMRCKELSTSKPEGTQKNDEALAHHNVCALLK